MEIDNCVVCGKYLKDIGEQEQLMCIDCNEKTEKVSQEQLMEDNSNKRFRLWKN